MLHHLALLLLATAPRAEIAPLSFADAVREADRIVYAEVVRIHDVPSDRAKLDDVELDEEWPIRVAELRVEGVLKGPPARAPLLVLASPTWTCDATNVALGERGLFFLATPASRERQHSSWQRACVRTFPATSVEVIVGSGQAEILEKAHDGRALLQCFIDLPSNVPSLRLHECELFEREVIERLVRETIEKQRRPLLTAELLAPMGAEGWRLVLACDRSARLTAAGFTREIRLESLGMIEIALLQPEAPLIEGSYILPAERDDTVRLVLHARNGDREFQLHFRRSATTPEEGSERQVLQLWSALSDELREATVAEVPPVRIPKSPTTRPRH